MKLLATVSTIGAVIYARRLMCIGVIGQIGVLVLTHVVRPRLSAPELDRAQT